MDKRKTMIYMQDCGHVASGATCWIISSASERRVSSVSHSSVLHHPQLLALPSLDISILSLHLKSF